MVGVPRYGSDVPFYRPEGLEGSLGIPLAVSTQWEKPDLFPRTRHPSLE